MTDYRPPMAQLRGLSYDVAERYGKPCIGASYRRMAMGATRLDRYAQCAVCGENATNAHHWPPRSKGPFLLRTPLGGFVLLPALIAVCGSGTFGCHDGFHSGAWASADWTWDTERDAEEWWNGRILSKAPPHSPELYERGCWRFFDARSGATWEYRGE